MLRAATVLAFAASFAFAALERAHILVQKVITAPETQHYLVKGRNFTVAYHVLNVGGESAYAVKLSDDWPADTFKHIEGTSSRTWEKIAPGGNETVTVVLSPLVSGSLTSKGASVEYKYRIAAEDDEEAVHDEGNEGFEEDEDDEMNAVQSYSTAPGRVDILTTDVYNKLAVDTGLYYTITSAAAILLVSLAASNWYSASTA